MQGEIKWNAGNVILSFAYAATVRVKLRRGLWAIALAALLVTRQATCAQAMAASGSSNKAPTYACCYRNLALVLHGRRLQATVFLTFWRHLGRRSYPPSFRASSLRLRHARMVGYRIVVYVGTIYTEYYRYEKR